MLVDIVFIWVQPTILGSKFKLDGLIQFLTRNRLSLPNMSATSWKFNLDSKIEKIWGLNNPFNARAGYGNQESISLLWRWSKFEYRWNFLWAYGRKNAQPRFFKFLIQLKSGLESRSHTILDYVTGKVARTNWSYDGLSTWPYIYTLL